MKCVKCAKARSQIRKVLKFLKTLRDDNPKTMRPWLYELIEHELWEKLNFKREVKKLW